MATNIVTRPHAIKWLSQLEEYARSLEKSQRVELRLYIHPEGFGFIQYLNQNSHTGGSEQHVNDFDEACDLLRALWERAASLPGSHIEESEA